MSNTEVETEETPIEESEPEQQAEGAPQEGDQAEAEAEGENDGEKDTKEDDLPEWVRTKMSAANSEAAKYRTALRDAEAKLADAKTVEEFEAATAELRTQNENLEHQILVRDVAADAGLPKELAEVLKGSTEEELKAHAKVLAKFAPATGPEHLGGGLDPNEPSDEEFDPVAAALKARQRRY